MPPASALCIEEWMLCRDSPFEPLAAAWRFCFHSSNPQWSRALIGAEGRPSSAMTQSSSFIPLFNLQFDGFFYLNASDVSDQGTRRVPLEPGVTCSSIPGVGTRDNQVVDESISDLSRVWGIIEGHLTESHCHCPPLPLLGWRQAHARQRANLDGPLHLSKFHHLQPWATFPSSTDPRVSSTGPVPEFRRDGLCDVVEQRTSLLLFLLFSCFPLFCVLSFRWHEPGVLLPFFSLPACCMEVVIVPPWSPNDATTSFDTICTPRLPCFDCPVDQLRRDHPSERHLDDLPSPRCFRTSQDARQATPPNPSSRRARTVRVEPPPP